MKVSAVIVDAKIVAAMEVTEVTAMKAEFSHFQPSVFEGCLARGLLFPRLGLLLFGGCAAQKAFSGDRRCAKRCEKRRFAAQNVPLRMDGEGLPRGRCDMVPARVGSCFTVVESPPAL